MVADIRSQRRQRAWSWVAAGGAAAAVLLTVGGLGAVMALGGFPLPGDDAPPAENFAGGIGCTEVVAAMPAYHQRQLDDEKMIRIAAHLEGCNHCRGTYQRMAGQTAARGTGFQPVGDLKSGTISNFEVQNATQVAMR